jgi:hypothetical protein
MQVRSRPASTAVLVLAVAIATLAAGCTGSPTTIADAPRSPSHGPVTVPDMAPAADLPTPRTETPRQRPVPQPPSAADSLAAFFAAARADDARIRAAARAVNREIGPSSVHVTRAMVKTAEAATPERTARAIPAGLDADLLQATMIVYSDLATRASALNPALDFIGINESRPRTDPDVVRYLDGLHRGSLVARAYPSDLASARALAATKPPVVAAQPGSRAAAELAVRIAVVQLGNGCDGGNPPVRRSLVPIIWRLPGTSFEGSVGGIGFTAGFGIEGGGWNVNLNAC